MKRDVRRLERSARLSGTSDATADWYSKRREYRGLCRRKREQFWRRVNYGALLTPYSVAGSGLRQLTPRHRRFRRFLLTFHSASFNQ